MAERIDDRAGLEALMRAQQEEAQKQRERLGVNDPAKIMGIVDAPKPADPINPKHYHGDRVMRIIEEFDLGFCLGNVVKYVLRHKNKAGLEDLKKARWYLERAIAQLEGKLYEGVPQ